MINNAQIKRLVSIFNEKKLSHSYLIVTTNIEKALSDINEFLITIFDDKENNFKNLLKSNSHPNIITIKPQDNKIKKEVIDSLKSSFSLQPILIDYNIYIICEPEKMNNTAYNRLLKFVEEPEKNIIGFFITTKKIRVPATIISRCEIIKCIYNEDEGNIDDENTYAIAKKYIENIENNNNVMWYNNSVLLKELPERESIVKLFDYLWRIYSDKKDNQTYRNNYKKLNIISKYIEQLNYNVNLSLLLNSFGIEMSEVNEEN